MLDNIDEMLRGTTAIMTELSVKAREAVQTGTSRRSFFARTAGLAGATVLGTAGAGLMQPIAAAAATRPVTGNRDTVQEILNVAATAELLATTFYYQALQNPTGLPNVNSTANQNYFQAALSQEYEHKIVLEKLGGKTLRHAFYFPDNMFTSESVFFPTAITLEKYFIAAYLQASLDFSGAVSTQITAANPYALGFAVQVFGVECEHKALLGVAGNVTPPNDVAFEQALLTNLKQAEAALAPFLVGGSGFSGPITPPTSSALLSAAGPYTPESFTKSKII